MLSRHGMGETQKLSLQGKWGGEASGIHSHGLKRRYLGTVSENDGRQQSESKSPQGYYKRNTSDHTQSHTAKTTCGGGAKQGQFAVSHDIMRLAPTAKSWDGADETISTSRFGSLSKPSSLVIRGRYARLKRPKGRRALSRERRVIPTTLRKWTDHRSSSRRIRDGLPLSSERRGCAQAVRLAIARLG